MSEDQENLVEEEPKASAPEDNAASVEATKEEKPQPIIFHIKAVIKPPTKAALKFTFVFGMKL